MSAQSHFASERKTRYEFVDNGRFIALFLIVFFHLFNAGACDDTTAFIHSWLYRGPFLARNSFFLFFAGYFLARNPQWKVIRKRFFSLMVPLLLWNALVYYGMTGHPFSVKEIIPNLLGVNYLFSSHGPCIFGAQYASVPAIGPSWFLRDVLCLTVLTPFIVRFRQVIPFGVIIMLSVTPLSFLPDSNALFAPGTVLPYIIGVYLSRYELSYVYQFFNKKCLLYYVLFFIVISLLVAMSMCSKNSEMVHLVQKTRFISGFGSVCSIALIAYTGLIIEKKLPGISRKMSACGPACFLVFMLHTPLASIYKSYMPDVLWSSNIIAILFPGFVFFSIVGLYFLMKKYLPWLMPIVANVRLPKS